MTLAPSISDLDLVQQTLHGNVGAFEQLYHRHKSRLYSLAVRLHGNTTDAEDSLQESFIRAYQSLGTFDRAASFSTWLYRIVINTCLSTLRRHPRREEHRAFLSEQEHPWDHAPMEDVELVRILDRELLALPPLHKTVFLLHAQQGFTHEEIADILHIRPGTSKSHYHRARKRLQKRLMDLGVYPEVTTHEIPA